MFGQNGLLNCMKRLHQQVFHKAIIRRFIWIQERYPRRPESFTQAIAGNLTWGKSNKVYILGELMAHKEDLRICRSTTGLGWNFINTPIAHAGLNIRGSIPAGTRSKAIYLFEANYWQRASP